MSPASYQTAPPRVGVSSAIAPAVRPGESGKRDSNPRPQPWQGCALPTELFPHDLLAGAIDATLRATHHFARHHVKNICLLRRPSGGEGNRTPDLLNAIQALSQLSYAPGTRVETRNER